MVRRPQYTLRDGDQWTCIFNLRKPDFGAPDPDILGPAEDHDGHEAPQERQLMQRAPELEAMLAGDEPVVARQERPAQPAARWQLFLFWAGSRRLFRRGLGARPACRDMLEGDEEFTTTTFRPPSFVRDGEPQPEPAEPEIRIITLPTAASRAVPEGDGRHDRVRRSATACRRRRPIRRQRQRSSLRSRSSRKRFVSKQIVLDIRQGRCAGSLCSGESEEGLTVAGEDRNSKFLAAASSLGDRSAKARKIERIDALIPEGTLIPGILETAIVSDLPGQIRAIVSQDVYSFDGRRVLIPTGTRLIGEYQSEITRGQKRIFVIWTRCCATTACPSG